MSWTDERAVAAGQRPAAHSCPALWPAGTRAGIGAGGEAPGTTTVATVGAADAPLIVGAVDGSAGVERWTVRVAGRINH
jgi:hypothetical protein